MLAVLAERAYSQVYAEVAILSPKSARKHFSVVFMCIVHIPTAGRSAELD